MVLFHGSTTLQPELFKAQVTALAAKIQQRLDYSPAAAAAASSDTTTMAGNEAISGVNSNNNNSTTTATLGSQNERSSGIIVNTNGWIQDEGFQLLLHTVDVMHINVVLIMGHDRLYSLMSNHFNKKKKTTNPVIEDPSPPPKIIKLPRSGGTVSRESAFLRQARSRSMKRYFYGDMVESSSLLPGTTNPSSSLSSSGTSASTAAAAALGSVTRVPQLTPFLNHIQFKTITLYKLSAMALSASLLPVAQQQSTDSIQVQQVELSEALQHALLAVCHPLAVAAYEQSGRARDLYESGVAGFCAVERVVMDTDTVHLLCPCAGSLPSQTLLVGDITWME